MLDFRYVMEKQFIEFEKSSIKKQLYHRLKLAINDNPLSNDHPIFNFENAVRSHCLQPWPAPSRRQINMFGKDRLES